MPSKEKQVTTDPDAKFLMELFGDDVEKKIILELSREHDPDIVIKRLLDSIGK